jgi:hypothetical protein
MIHENIFRHQSLDVRFFAAHPIGCRRQGRVRVPAAVLPQKSLANISEDQSAAFLAPVGSGRSGAVRPHQRHCSRPGHLAGFYPQTIGKSGRVCSASSRADPGESAVGQTRPRRLSAGAVVARPVLLSKRTHFRSGRIGVVVWGTVIHIWSPLIADCCALYDSVKIHFVNLASTSRRPGRLVRHDSL